MCEPQPVCDLYVSVVANCSETSNEYFLDITVFGSEEYEIYIGGFGEPIDVVTAGTYTYGPYTTNQYNVYAQSIDGGFFGNCFNQVFGEIECNTGGQACNLNVTNTQFECAADNSFRLKLYSYW